MSKCLPFSLADYSTFFFFCKENETFRQKSHIFNVTLLAILELLRCPILGSFFDPKLGHETNFAWPPEQRERDLGWRSKGRMRE